MKKKNVQAASFQQKGKGSNTFASYEQLHFLASLFATSEKNGGFISSRSNVTFFSKFDSSTREIATNRYDLEFLRIVK